MKREFVYSSKINILVYLILFTQKLLKPAIVNFLKNAIGGVKSGYLTMGSPPYDT